MIKENKTQLMVSSILILLPMLWGLYILPLLTLALFWLCVVITAKDPGNRGQNPKILKIIFYIIPLLFLVENGLFFVCVNRSYSDVDATSITFSLMGLMFIVIGNYLPKVKQNRTIGIKINWTLKNEENWNKTHRFAGKLWFVGGVVMLSTMFMKQNLAIAIFFTDLVIMVVWPIFYSYQYHKTQLANGTIKKEDYTLTAKEKRTNKIGIALGIVIFAMVGAIVLMGDYTIEVNESSIRVDAMLWSDIEIKMSDIESVEQKESDNIGSRTFGYGAPNLYMGEFLNDEYGNYVRYSRGGCDANIVIKTKNKTYVINEKNAELTKNIYEEIMSIME